MGERQLTFAIQGEFITRLAREWLFYEGKDIEKIMDLLLNCMGGIAYTENGINRSFL